MVIWDVNSGTVVASLEDPLAAALSPGPVARKTEPGKGGAVKGLAWIMSNPCVLAIVMANGMFLVWDPQGMPALSPTICTESQPLLWHILSHCTGIDSQALH